MFVTASTVLLSTLALTAFAAPAHADDGPIVNAPPGSPDTVGDHVDANQNQLMDFKSWILDQPGLAESGYIESVNDSSTLSTTLLWSGPEDDLQGAIIAEGQGRGIAVSVEHRAFSLAQLNRAADKIVSQGESAISGFRWTAIFVVTGDFDGIVVAGTSTTSGANSLNIPDTATAATVAQRVKALTGVAVKVKTGVDSQSTVGQRWSDYSPFNAGGLMLDGPDICSTGFSVKVGGTAYTTTARHCLDHHSETL